MSAAPRYGYTTPPTTMLLPRDLPSFECSEEQARKFVAEPLVIRSNDYRKFTCGRKRPERDGELLADPPESVQFPETGKAPAEDKAPGEDKAPALSIHAAAVELGRRGGLKGGPARREKLSPEERSRIAREAARRRYVGHVKKTPRRRLTPEERSRILSEAAKRRWAAHRANNPPPAPATPPAPLTPAQLFVQRHCRKEAVA